MNCKNIDEFIKRLDRSTTEEDIFRNLIDIVKNFNVSLYKSRILSNPYYKSIIPDVTKLVKTEILDIRESIINEIAEIDNEISKPNNKHIKSLKELRSECVYLLYEIQDRERDINKLI